MRRRPRRLQEEIEDVTEHKSRDHRDETSEPWLESGKELSSNGKSCATLAIPATPVTPICLALSVAPSAAAGEKRRPKTFNCQDSNSISGGGAALQPPAADRVWDTYRPIKPLSSKKLRGNRRI